MEKRYSLGLCMIVKNEENNIARCLESVKDIVDEIVVVDTGSDDKTIEIAQRYGAKIFYYKWDDSFSSARNYSIEQSSCDWILLLDADEQFDKSDTEQLIDFINTSDKDGAHFEINNYVGDSTAESCSVHSAFRLLRNNGQYHFVGEIHEQITKKSGKTKSDRFSTLNVKLYHYGYMRDEIIRKNKRERNIPLLEKQLKSDPKNSFVLFNLGNEYLAMNDFKKALSYYLESLKYFDYTQGYTPHLYFRTVNCLLNMNDCRDALKYLDDALVFYPKCTDMVFLKGYIYKRQKKFSLAAEYLCKALEMGESPQALKFLNGCGTYLAADCLGDLYFSVDDYKKALEYYKKAVDFKPDFYSVLYKIGKAICKVTNNPDEISKAVYSYFKDENYEPNVIVANDIFISEKQYELAVKDIQNKNKTQKYDKAFLFLTAKAKYFTGDYDTAIELFGKALSSKADIKQILPNIDSECVKHMFVIDMIKGNNLPQRLRQIKSICCDTEYKISRQFYLILKGKNEVVFKKDDDVETLLKGIFEVLDKVLKVSEFGLFEKLLGILNTVESKEVLTNLAKLYYNNSIIDMAVKTSIQSLKELDTIDPDCIEILYREIC